MSSHSTFKEISEALKDVFASIVGSAACVYSGQPFDTIKVRMQVETGKFGNPFDCFRSTLRSEGVTALWKGSTPAFLGALSENAMAFAIMGFLKRYMNSEQETKFSVVTPFLMGGITGSFSAFALCPYDVLKCRAQLSRSHGLPSGVKDVFSNIIATKGYRGFYTGVHCQVMRDIPFYSSFFGTYELMCHYLKEHTTWSDSSVYIVSGGIAGQVGWVVSIVPDSIKSRIQTSTEVVTPSIRNTVQGILRDHGLKGFFRGIEVAIVRAFPANAALFFAYETTRRALEH